MSYTNLSKMIGSVSVLMALLHLVTVPIANAGPAEDEVFASFETYCIAHLNQSEKIPELLKQVGSVPMSEDMAKGFLGPQKGSAWFHKTKSAHLSIVLTDEGVCTISSPDVNGKIVKSLFEEHSKIKMLRTENVGSQKQEFYSLTLADQYGGADINALVMIATSNLQSVGGVFLNAIPERAISAQGTNTESRSSSVVTQPKKGTEKIVRQCSLSDDVKIKLRQGICNSTEYGSFTGQNCVEKNLRKRAEDSGIQVQSAKMCGFINEAKRLEDLTLSAIPYMKSFYECIGATFDTKAVFSAAYNDGKQLAERETCSYRLKSKLRSRLPTLLSMGRKGLEMGKSLNQKLGIE